jgi:flagellar hook assembly protein FlgD
MQYQQQTPPRMRQQRRNTGSTITPGVLTTALSIGAVVLIVAITFIADWMQVPELSLSPQGQFLSPNGDGSYDVFTINYRLVDGARVTALVMSDQNVIRSLVSNQSEAAGDHFIAWDGRNEIGSVAPDGFYRIEVTAAGTMRSKTQSVQAQLDTQPPTVQLANLPEGMNVNTPNLQIEGVTEPGAMIWLNGTAQPQRVDNVGRFTFPLKLTDGNNSIDLQAIDPAGNVARIQRSIVLVTQPPDITILRPLENEWTNQQMVTIEGNTRAGATLTINQQPVRVEQDGSFRYELILNQGDNSLRFVATDAVGNVASLDRVVHLKTGAMPIQVNVQDGAVIGDANLQLTGKVEPGSLVTVNGIAVPVNAFGDFQTTTSLLSGDNTIAIEARDLAGNVTTLARRVSYEPNGTDTMTRLTQNMENLPILILPSVLVIAGILAFTYLRQNRVDLALSVDQPALIPGLPGSEKSLVILLDLSKTARLSLEVFDQQGYLRSSIVQNRRKIGRRHVFHWNGYDDRGMLLPAGDYTIRAEAGAPPLQVTSSVQVRLERPLQSQVQTPSYIRTTTVSTRQEK